MQSCQSCVGKSIRQGAAVQRALGRGQLPYTEPCSPFSQCLVLTVVWCHVRHRGDKRNKRLANKQVAKIDCEKFRDKRGQ